MSNLDWWDRVPPYVSGRYQRNDGRAAAAIVKTLQGLAELREQQGDIVASHFCMPWRVTCGRKRNVLQERIRREHNKKPRPDFIRVVK